MLTRDGPQTFKTCVDLIEIGEQIADLLFGQYAANFGFACSTRIDASLQRKAAARLRLGQIFDRSGCISELSLRDRSKIARHAVRRNRRRRRTLGKFDNLSWSCTRPYCRPV